MVEQKLISNISADDKPAAMKIAKRDARVKGIDLKTHKIELVFKGRKFQRSAYIAYAVQK